MESSIHASLRSMVVAVVFVLVLLTALLAGCAGDDDSFAQPTGACTKNQSSCHDGYTKDLCNSEGAAFHEGETCKQFGF